ncbi:MAG: AMIN domain-containing protein [Terriglobia bacterium]
MKTKALVVIALGCLLGVAAGMNRAQSLGDLAREERAKRQSQPKAVTVYTNDNALEGISIEETAPATRAPEALSTEPASKTPAADDVPASNVVAVVEPSRTPPLKKQPESSKAIKEYGKGGFPTAPANLARAAGPLGAVQAPTGAAADDSIKVSGITIQAGVAGGTVVNIATSSPAPYRVLQLEGPRRLVVDLEGAYKTAPQESYPAESPLLKRVRVGQFRAEKPAVVRVVLELSGNPAFDVRATPDGVRVELKPRDLPALLSAVPGAQGEAAKPPQESVTPPGQQPALQPPPRPAVPGPSMPGAPNVFYQLSPFKSLPQNQKLLDSLGLRIVLAHNYRKGDPEEAAWKTKGTPGVEANRLFIKSIGAASYRTLELAITPSPQGGYDLAVYGQQIIQTAQGPNPDLPAIQQLVNSEVARMQQSPPPVLEANQLSYETYYLSYVIADRAIALLKALGYTTVEYNQLAGESTYQNIYNPVKQGTRPPIIVKLIDSTKTSLMEPTPTTPGAAGQMQAQAMAQMAQQAGAMMMPTTSGVPAIGGTYLHQMTSGETQQQLLILYDKDDPESLQKLMDLLQSTIDVPAREIMIEAQVIELNSNRTRDLGVTFETVQNNVDVASAGTDAVTGAILPIFLFTKGSPRIASFNAQLQALVQTGEAEILSNPSVLVLDGRQARIQIGQQVPVAQSATSVGTTIASVSYFPVGIVLNLRPRINEDGSEITMQTEAIVSAINTAACQQLTGTKTCIAPVIDNRQVQSIVRVADNTPFIIGGLISTNNNSTMSGIPWLSQIPGLGALFRRTTVTKVKQEVIIVITPHVVPLEDKYFSYVIPKDSDQFNRFDYRLFRNAYRIRGNDLFDLEFVYGSNVYKQLVGRVTKASTSDPQLRKTEPFASVLKGGAPGEDILVRRMLWEIIQNLHYERYIDPERIIFFESNPSAAGGSGFKISFLEDKLKALKDGQTGLALTFEAQPKGDEERPFVPPKAVLGYPDVSAETYPQMLISGNRRNPDGTPRDWVVLISKNHSGISSRGIRVSPVQLLQGVLVLKRLLGLNPSMSLKEFHIGRQIIFPSQEELKQGNQLIDREVAKLFYEVYNYYPVFEQEFNRETRQMNAMLDKIGPQQ